MVANAPVINGTARLRLTLGEVAELMNVGRHVVRQRVVTGEWPPPMNEGGKCVPKFWDARRFMEWFEDGAPNYKAWVSGKIARRR